MYKNKNIVATNINNIKNKILEIENEHKHPLDKFDLEYKNINNNKFD